MFDLDRYAERVGLSRREATREGLIALQRAQLSTIAFENIDPFLGVVPSLNPADIWAKLVLNRRGGYCFEVNWLFGEALARIGFAARPLLGRVRMGAPVGGIRAHAAWIVMLDGRDWLADAGFGGPGPRDPLEIRPGLQVAGGVGFRFREDGRTGEWVLERQTPEGWFALFGFDETGFTEADIEGANYLCACSPQQPFRNNLMMSIRRDGEDASLLGRRLTRQTGEAARAEELRSATELARHLRELFGIRCDDGTVTRLWARLGGGMPEQGRDAA